jgi:hypothetical protein
MCHLGVEQAGLCYACKRSQCQNIHVERCLSLRACRVVQEALTTLERLTTLALAMRLSVSVAL